MSKTPKSIDELMLYLRTHHKITIDEKLHTRKLRNIGYYHGFKGYRYNRTPHNKIAYTDFNEILAINEFDMALKSMFYPQLMFIETALKNYALELVLEVGQTSNLNDIFNNLLCEYTKHPTHSIAYRHAMQRKLDLRAKLFGTLTYAYRNHKKVVTHFYQKNDNVPVWALFEIINLGEFGSFVQCLEQSLKTKLSKTLLLNQTCDTDAKLTQTIVFIIKDLRNAVAHNEIIFDTRFRSAAIGHNVISCLEIDTFVKPVNFKNIIDYLVLIVYLLKNLEVSVDEILKTISLFEEAAETLRRKIPINMYMDILPTDTRNKLSELKIFVKK